MTLGQKIRAARLERGLTQKQVVGQYITRNMLSKIENDSATPSVRTLEYLAQALGLPASYFLSGTSYSDGSSPDGLDKMRQAYRAGNYAECLCLLRTHQISASTDEGYLLYAKAAAALAQQSFQAGDLNAAKENADIADYYNREGLYVSQALGAEMNLLLCECSLLSADGEFESYAQRFLQAEAQLPQMGRFLLNKASFLLQQGEIEAAAALVAQPVCQIVSLSPLRHYVQGSLALAQKDYKSAAAALREAETTAAENRPLLQAIYSALEICYRELSDFELAYHYAAKQLR